MAVFWDTEYITASIGTILHGGSKLFWNVCQYLPNYTATFQKAGPSGRADWSVGLDHLNAETVGSYPA
jgi:hypothetical protein